jgi:hypothetical protein
VPHRSQHQRRAFDVLCVRSAPIQGDLAPQRVRHQGYLGGIRQASAVHVEKHGFQVIR